jgi:type VI secretion system protein ImpK
MSDTDDPFGRRDRTIIRPNPGGRRPGPSPGGSPPASAPNPPVSYPPPPQQPAYPPPPPPPQAYPQQPYQPQPSYQPPSAYPPPPSAPQSNWDGWASPPPQPTSPYMQQGPGVQPLVPAPASPHIPVDIETATANPLMRAAASLLLLLGRLRASLSRAGSGQLMDQVAQSITQFETEARGAGVATEQIVSAKYALAATADDIVQNLPTDDRQLWTKYSMLVRFFGERTGGVRFFQELDRAKQNPALNLGLLEVMHACMCLGFEGVYRTSPGGVGTLQGIRRDIYETIRRVQSKTIEDLSPHWRGQTIALAGSRFRVPVWSAAALACLILLGVYLLLRNFLSDEAEALALKMANLQPSGEVTIARETIVKPPPDPPARASTQLQRIRAALADEIMRGKLSADQNATSIIIRIGNLVLFPSGEAKVNASFAPIAAKIARTLEKEPGGIHIDGYSDTDPIKTVTFPSNWELSEARAKSVASILKPELSKPDRVAVSGKGEQNPIAANDTAENKSKNRRVEISIPRAD